MISGHLLLAQRIRDEVENLERSVRRAERVWQGAKRAQADHPECHHPEQVAGVVAFCRTGKSWSLRPRVEERDRPSDEQFIAAALIGARLARLGVALNRLGQRSQPLAPVQRPGRRHGLVSLVVVHARRV